MTSDRPQPEYLTVSGLVVSYALYAGVGYLLAGWIGAACGAALLTVMWARRIWLAVPADGHTSG